VSGSTDFFISSPQKGFISFDRTNTIVNDDNYKHIGNWPEFSPGEEVVIVQPILNELDIQKDVDIKYELYFWDSLNSKDLLNTKEEKITIAAGEAKNLQYVIPKMEDSVYYLKITASFDGQKSIINIRLLSPQEHARLNYPAITKFPIRQNDQFTLFSCFHNSSAIATSGKVEVLLTDKDENKIGGFVYNGAIMSSMMADKVEVVAKDDYDYVNLYAKIYNNDNELVDEYHTVYDCMQLDNCKADNNKISHKKINKSNNDTQKMVMIATLIIITIIIIIVIILVIKKNKK
jgi:hypothetical protein